MKKALLIYNPVAGRKRSQSALDKVIHILSQEYLLVVRDTQGVGDGANIVRENQNENFDAIICCGGDGTLNEVIHGILEYKLTVPIGYIPSGSTNDFAKSLRIPINPTAAATNILRGSIKSIDIGLFNESRHFSYIASFGAFTEASYSTPQHKKNTFGHLAYITHGTREFFALKKSPVYAVKITLPNGEAIQGEYFFGAVSNATSVAGLIRFPQDSVSFCDGLFEAFFVRKPKRNREWFSLLSDIVHHRVDQNPLVDTCKASEMTISLSHDMNWTLDGEKAATGNIVKISNQKQALQLFV